VVVDATRSFVVDMVRYSEVFRVYLQIPLCLIMPTSDATDRGSVVSLLVVVVVRYCGNSIGVREGLFV
jgi:hypothetical protein